MGQAQRLPEKLDENAIKDFPNLSPINYRIHSPKTGKYNCIAHAANDETRKWDSCQGYYWPPKAVRGDDIEALVSAFEAIGYERCQDGKIETGYDKVVLYAYENGEWTHAAKQLGDGLWSSKLGNSFDIRHNTPHAVSGGLYGKVIYFMKCAKS